MKHLFLLLAFSSLLMGGAPVFAQAQREHAKFYHNVKKLGDKRYQVTFHLDLDRGWHMITHLDDSEKKYVAPTFNFYESKQYKLRGKTKRKGILSMRKLKNDDVVAVYSYKTIFTQEVLALPGSRMEGTFSYHIANDQLIMDPKTKDFVVVFK